MSIFSIFSMKPTPLKPNISRASKTRFKPKKLQAKMDRASDGSSLQKQACIRQFLARQCDGPIKTKQEWCPVVWLAVTKVWWIFLALNTKFYMMWYLKYFSVLQTHSWTDEGHKGWIIISCNKNYYHPVLRSFLCLLKLGLLAIDLNWSGFNLLFHVHREIKLKQS